MSAKLPDDISQRLVQAREKAAIDQFGNSVLYDMCEKEPRHVDENVIKDKIWIIGRTYAASIERQGGGNAVHRRAARELMTVGAELDSRIAKLQGVDFGLDSIVEVLSTHDLVIRRLQEASRKRLPHTGLAVGDGAIFTSFAAKYLHFHGKRAFPIYDQHAERAVKRMVKEQPKSVSSSYDQTYEKFCRGVTAVMGELEDRFPPKLNLRELDILLVKLGRDMKRGRGE